MGEFEPRNQDRYNLLLPFLMRPLFLSLGFRAECGSPNYLGEAKNTSRKRLGPRALAVMTEQIW
jgi:hypothetical protein